MKLTTLKIVTNEKTTQTAEAAIIKDAPPPPIHAVPASPRIVRHLDVDEILERSLPKVAEGFEKAA